MKKYFNRYPKNLKKYHFTNGKKVSSIKCIKFEKKYGIHGIIKILSRDFRLINKNANKLTHFNVQYTLHKPKKKYLIAKIDKAGFFDGKSYKPPILSSKGFILVKCISEQNHINYDEIKKETFKYSLNNIKNINDLKKTIKRRYKKSLAHLSDSKKLSLGVAITKLDIVKRF
mgnify:FL=1|jgi:hypothetical protein